MLKLFGVAVLMFFVGVFLLRFAGRKSIAQMTLAQTVVMISIQPFLEHNLWKTILAASTFISLLFLVEYLQVKFNWAEKLFTGKSKVLIESGVLKEDQIKKLRMTVDQLEMQLRQKGVSNISDIQTATMEPNGQVGFELKPDARPLTVGEFKKMMGTMIILPADTPELKNIFEELKNESDAPEHLQ